MYTWNVVQLNWGCYGRYQSPSLGLGDETKI
jgi:hypothetical protein